LHAQEPRAESADTLDALLLITGSVNELVLGYDDGQQSGSYQATNDAFTTRLVFRGLAEFTEDWSGGFWTEIGLSGARSVLVNQAGDGANVGTSVRLRRASGRIRSETFGELRIGQAMPATRSIILANANDGVGAFSGADVVVIGGSFRFRNGDGTLSGLSPVNFTVGSIDTERRNLVRYDSPAFVGVFASVAWASKGFWDVGVRYDGQISAFSINGGIGYVNLPGDSEVGPGFGRDVNELKGSLSVLHQPTGLFLDLAGVHRKLKANDGLTALPDFDTRFVRAGIVADLLQLGPTVLFGEYSNSTDALSGRDFTDDGLGMVSSSRMKVHGVAAVQRIDAADMAWYLAYRQFDASATGSVGSTNFGSIRLVFGGMRIFFGARLPQLES
jgi:hypothetical protein